MDISLFEHEMLFVENQNVNFKRLVQKEKKQKHSMKTNLQIGFGKYKKFIEIVVPIRFKIPNFTNL